MAKISLGSLTPSKKREYRVTNRLHEVKRAIDSRYSSAGGNRKDESFYTVSWACNMDETPFLVAGGLNGIIRVVDTGNEKIYKSFVLDGDSATEAIPCCVSKQSAGGHHNEVLSVDFHLSDICRIASCGMDVTVKIWSMKEGFLMAFSCIVAPPRII